MHESQSRLWENMVGRSRAILEGAYPQLQKRVPGCSSAPCSLDAFYRAINKVERSLIRTDADEVTYCLHVIMRFDFEIDLLEGKLARRRPARGVARALPRRPRRRTRPPTPTACLQDVHWYDGFVGGAFQGYALGNVMSAQFYERR